MDVYTCGHTKSGAVRTLGSWPDKSWKWLQKSGFFNWWNDRFIGQAHQASDDELWNWNSMEEGGSRKQVTKIKVIVFKSCILVRLNVPVAVRLLKLSIVEPTPRCLLIDIVLQNLFVFGWWIVELKFHGGGRIRKTGYNNKMTVFKSCVLVNIFIALNAQVFIRLLKLNIVEPCQYFLGHVGIQCNFLKGNMD